MTDAIERVARALCEEKLWPGAFEQETQGNRDAWRSAARAAIEAHQGALWPPMDLNSRSLMIDRRRMRADAITAHIMHAIGDYLCRHGETDGAREASRTLFKMLYEAGADIVTDVDRSNAGLAPRDHNGLTREEMQIMEAKRIEAMLSPLPPMFVAHPHS